MTEIAIAVLLLWAIILTWQYLLLRTYCRRLMEVTAMARASALVSKDGLKMLDGKEIPCQFGGGVAICFTTSRYSGEVHVGPDGSVMEIMDWPNEGE
jgi:hypothetical protein